MPYVVEGVSFRDAEGRAMEIARSGEPLNVRFALRCVRPLEAGFGNFAILSAEGAVCAVCRSERLDLSALGPGDTLALEVRMPQVPLTPGVYLLSFQLLAPSMTGYVAAMRRPYRLIVTGQADRAGLVRIPHTWHIEAPARARDFPAGGAPLPAA